MAGKLHITPVGYAVTFAALLLLTAITLGLSYVDLGRMAIPVAMTIASTKVVLVALFFMHLAEQRATNRIVAATAVVFVALLVILMVVDVDTRPGLAGEVEPREPLPPPQR